MTTLSRRGFLIGLLAAPAIVRAPSLMQIRGLPLVMSAPDGLVNWPASIMPGGITYVTIWQQEWQELAKYIMPRSIRYP